MSSNSSDNKQPDSIGRADIRWDENNQPISQQFNDVYFSRDCGLDESRYVFLEQNKLRARWQALENHTDFFIAESGFGTGLNFLATWQLWEHCLKNNAVNSHLHYFSVEKFPLGKHDLYKALALWPELDDYSSLLLTAWPPEFIAGIHKLQFPNITLHLFIGDIVDGFKQLIPAANCGVNTQKTYCSLGVNNPKIDAWYLDGFAPAKNPAMWRSEIFYLMSCLSKSNCTFSTFTSAGEVKRGLQAHNFNCKKIKGYGKKREMLCGEFNSDINPLPVQLAPQTHSTRFESSWHLVEQAQSSTQPSKAIVVGGGIAGSHVAYALARRGLKVTLIEKGDQLANAASSNHRAVLYTRISPHQDALSRFNLAALLFACRFYENESFFLSAGDQCGVLHLARNQREKDHFNNLSEMFKSYPEILTRLTPEKCSELAGNRIQKNGIFFPKAGWLDPVILCKELCSHPNIEVLTNLEVNSFSRPDSNWEVETNNQQTLHSELLILANAKDLTYFQQAEHLQLKNIRGQVSYLPELPASIMQPSTVICAEGYIAPLDNCGVCIGASFNLNSSDEDISETDHSDNLQRMSEIFPDYAEHIQNTNIAALQGNVGFRCTTPDYFPVVGPLPITEQIATRFSSLRKRAKAQVDACGVYHPNLFCLTGLGSRGLAYAPLAADALASSILGEPLPINSDLWLHLHPARFIIRNLIRNQPIPGLNSV